jgi:hypothetical protein
MQIIEEILNNEAIREAANLEELASPQAGIWEG